MRSIAELKRKYHQLDGSNLDQRQIAELATTGITDTSTTQFTEMVTRIWSDEVILFGESLRKMDQICIINKDMVGSKADRVIIPFTSSHLTVDVASSTGEGDLRDLTELTNMDTRSLQISSTDWMRGAVGISKQAFMTNVVDLVKQAKYVIAEDIADDVDLAIASALQVAAGSQEEVFGGASTNADASDLAAGDVLTTDLIVDAIVKIKEHDFVPWVLFIGPAQEGILLKDSQFVNAAEYGSNEVVLKGEIGMYLGIKIITTTNANISYAATDADIQDTTTWAVAGTACLMVSKNRSGQPVSCALAWKEMPHIDYEYWKDEARHMIYYDSAFKALAIHQNSICIIRVTDA